MADRKASPEREREIEVLERRLDEKEKENDRDVLRLSNMVSHKISELKRLTSTFQTQKQ